jgi:hypothetical protein
MLTLMAITYFIKQILDYGKARFNRQTAKNHMAMMERQMAHQQRLMELMLEAQARPRGRGSSSRSRPSLCEPLGFARDRRCLKTTSPRSPDPCTGPNKGHKGSIDH